MPNARKELLKAVKNTAKIRCASIFYGRLEDKASQKTLKLKYSEQDYNDFLDSLDFECGGGYGAEDLCGTVWLEDGAWLSRVGYHGSESWEHNVLPAISAECL